LVRAFHERHHLPVETGTRDGLAWRINLLLQELAEVSEVVTRGAAGPFHGFSAEAWQDLQQELIDLAYLWWGTAVHLGWTPDAIAQQFQETHARNLQRGTRHTGGRDAGGLGDCGADTE